MISDEATVQCPYCFETQALFLDPETHGEFVQDCDVCCNPWRVIVRRDGQGIPNVTVDRAQ